MMKVDRALKEVWAWKDEIYRLNKGKSMNDLIKFIKREAASTRVRAGWGKRQHKVV